MACARKLLGGVDDLRCLCATLNDLCFPIAHVPCGRCGRMVQGARVVHIGYGCRVAAMVLCGHGDRGVRTVHTGAADRLGEVTEVLAAAETVKLQALAHCCGHLQPSGLGPCRPNPCFVEWRLPPGAVLVNFPEPDFGAQRHHVPYASFL
jgi:hypothetical protein